MEEGLIFIIPLVRSFQWHHRCPGSHVTQSTLEPRPFDSEFGQDNSTTYGALTEHDARDYKSEG